MSDTFNVVANYDKPSYVGGQVITINISGNDVVTNIVTSQIGPLTIPIIANNGVKTTITAPAIQATVTTVSNSSVVIDTSLPIVDSSPSPRVWSVSANKLSLTAVA